MINFFLIAKSLNRKTWGKPDPACREALPLSGPVSAPEWLQNLQKFSPSIKAKPQVNTIYRV
jgi:hypothetical protein